MTEVTKSRSGGGVECFVLDEFIIKEETNKVKDDPKESNNGVTEDKPGGEEKKESTKENKENGTESTNQKNDGKKRGQNKNRPVFRVHQEKICHAYLDSSPGTEPKCTFTNCKFVHDIKTYMESKPEDLGSECYVFSQLGHCPRGVTCRWSSQHIDKDFKNLKNGQIYTGKAQEINQLNKDIQTKLRKKAYDFSLADKACDISFNIMRVRESKEKENHEAADCDNKNGETIGDNEACEEPERKKMKLESDEGEKSDKINGDNVACLEPEEKKIRLESEKGENRKKERPIGPASEEDLIKLRPQEKKTLDFRDKTYLAPLTTVGNLPFRRLCKKLGADITCSEMALGLPLLQGHMPEWALMKRHHSEDFFGIQVCGCSPPQMARVAQLIEENVDCDFVDINMGCPIDLIFKKGMGSGLMVRNRPIEVISRTMSSIMSRPLTIKMRTGVYKDKNIAHQLFPKLEDLGVSALTIHGRSREQRYTRLADWDYIGECKQTVNIPVFGNGDVFNYEDYYEKKESSGVDGIMIARAALIKPWIFTEIKEKRHWDITSAERLDIVKDFANFGLEHWGSDDKGLETTRRFLLEWLSFTYRYVPHGILKHPPQRINERIPALYRGRDEMETLLSSPNGQDWVKITEMFLGKVKDGFQFVPKHKANSYS